MSTLAPNSANKTTIEVTATKVRIPKSTITTTGDLAMRPTIVPPLFALNAVVVSLIIVSVNGGDSVGILFTINSRTLRKKSIIELVIMVNLAPRHFQ